jgi:hypothetical protein
VSHRRDQNHAASAFELVDGALGRPLPRLLLDPVDFPETRPGEGTNSDLVVIMDVARAS